MKSKFCRSFSAAVMVIVTIMLQACTTRSSTASATKDSDSLTLETQAFPEGIHRIDDEDTFRQWFAYFYIHKRTDLLPDAVKYMASHNYLHDHPDISAVFLAHVFASNPKHLPQWLEIWKPLDRESWGVILVSLQFADTPATTSLMHANIARTDAREQKRILDLEASGRTGSNLLEASIDDPRQINQLWSAYSATGDKRFVEKVVDYLSLYSMKDDTLDSDIGRAALATLASNSLIHPGVAEVCLKERKEHPNDEIRDLLTTMLTAVARYVEQEEALAH